MLNGAIDFRIQQAAARWKSAPEQLLGAADRNLYGMKHRGKSGVQNLKRIAACL